MQQITISGRIGKDAESRQAGDGTVTSFNVAVDQGYGDRKTSNWYRVSVWGKKGAGAAPYLLKGGQVTVVGEFEIGEYEGKPQYNIRASDFTLPAKGSGQSGGGDDYRGNRGSGQSQAESYGGNGGPSQRRAAPAFDDDDSEVPF